MKQKEISTLLKSFHLSDAELESRTALDEFANSLADIVIDNFAKDYLLNNPELSIYLAHTDSSRLLKNIKEFIAYILTSPIDERYIEKIHHVGSIHFTIKLEPAKVSYGFWAINEVLNKLAEVNELVKEYKSLISKVLRFVEHVMNDGYYIEKEKLYQYSSKQLQGFNAQNELYLAFQLHKQNMKKIKSSLDNKNPLRLIQEITESSSDCAFGEVLQTLTSNNNYKYLLGLDTPIIMELHDKWHEEFTKFKNSVKIDDKQDMKTYSDAISRITEQLKNILDTALQDSLKDGHTAVSSGIKAIKKTTALFNEKDIYYDFEAMIQKTVISAFDELSWAIDNIYINFDKKSENTYSIEKIYRYKSKNIYIGIELKKEQDSEYVYEMINMLLEILNLHFSTKEREVSLISFADKAEHANKSKDMFLANMSHELRTPLNAITGFSQIILMKKDTPETIKSYVQKINIAGNNLLDLVNTILDFAKLEAGKMQFNPKLSNISNIISEVTTLISSLAIKKDISIKMPNIISLNLYIDDKLFKQVLINLLTNAIKFTPSGGHISLSITYNETKRMYQFEVKDNGIGLSQESISKLFQAFSQIEGSYQKQEQGTGLGLMISKKIIEDLHKGKIRVESVEGEGSSFFIDMPTPMIESHTHQINEAPKGSRVALIVEDSIDYQNILANKLRSDLNMTFTDTVNKAKSLLAQNKYDLVILDFFLTDGISSEILDFMEEENVHIPTVVISAEDEISISSSLSGSSNLEGIINKKDIDDICNSIKGIAYNK